MAKKSEIGTILFKPATGFTVPGTEKGQWIKLGDIILTDGLAQELFGEEDEDDDKDAVTVTGRGLNVS